MAIMGKATKKYFAPPLTAEQISAGVGVTEEDKAIVHKVLTRLGYIGQKSAKASIPAPKKSQQS
jgi:hypothetical protein